MAFGHISAQISRLRRYNHWKNQMIRAARALLASMIALGGLASGGAQIAHAADLVAVQITEPGICGHPRVLGSIDNRFRHQVRHVPNLPQVGILDFYGIRETRYQPQSPDWPIERRYCQATVALSDGHSRSVWYLIERPMGFAGIGSNVEFCVDGFDRWNVYNGRCRVLR